MSDPLDPINPGTLEAARLARGVSRTALADAAGISYFTVRRIEEGHTGTGADTWHKLVAALVALPIKQAAA